MYEQLREYIEESNNIVFFGGAGVSTESGIPDFRSKDGLYNQHDVQFDKYEPEYLLSRECLYNNPKVFYEFYRQKMDTRNIEPNITHVEAISNADMLIIGGTSLKVYPAAHYISYFSGNHLVVINREKIQVLMNEDTDLMIVDSLGNVFSEIEKWM
jgi:NAD-dependent SIR2 family protein deacetylase